jgi:hypothetical protein
MVPSKFSDTVEIMSCTIARLEIYVLWVARKNDGDSGVYVRFSMNGGLPNMESYRPSQYLILLLELRAFDKIIHLPFTSSIEFSGPGWNLPGL